MFAILFSKSMDPFYEIFLSFPTVIFSFLLVLCVIFGLIIIVGAMDLDVLNVDAPDIDGGLDVDPTNITSGHILVSLFMRFGLVGIPAPIVFFLITLFGWCSSFILSYYLYPKIPDGFLQYAVGLVMFCGLLYVSAFVTGLVLRPFKEYFKTESQEVNKDIVGQVAVVRTSKVNKDFGEANVNDGGAGLIVKVRSYKDDETFGRGDRVVLLEYIQEEHIYKVISEKEFSQ